MLCWHFPTFNSSKRLSVGKQNKISLNPQQRYMRNLEMGKYMFYINEDELIYEMRCDGSSNNSLFAVIESVYTADNGLLANGWPEVGLQAVLRFIELEMT